MSHYKDWFAVNKEKRAGMSRSRPLGRLLKELLANSFDAGAKNVSITCNPAVGTRRDKAGLQGFDFTCEDDGRGCEDPEILRTVGSSTSELHPETRGRFGQGLIEVVAACEEAVLSTLRHRLQFDAAGCKISTLRGDPIQGMTVRGTLRHSGDGYAELVDYFASVIVPVDVRMTINGEAVVRREAVRTVQGLKLTTVVYDMENGRWKRPRRATAVEILKQWGTGPVIYELGIPVDRMPWTLPYDVNVLQKTPLDTERDMLPDTYKQSLLAQLVPAMSDEYQRATEDHGVPDEIAGSAALAERLSDQAKEAVIRKTTGAEPDTIVRRNPFHTNDPSESAELEQRHGYSPVSLSQLPKGVASLLKDAPTVAKKHDEVCKVHFQHGRLPPVTKRQRECLEMYAGLAGAILGRSISCSRGRGSGFSAAWGNGAITLNIDVAHLWDDPLGEESIGTVLHECAHDKVSGHSLSFQDEIASLGGRLAAWVAKNPSWWQQWCKRLYEHDSDDRGK